MLVTYDDTSPFFTTLADFLVDTILLSKDSVSI